MVTTKTTSWGRRAIVTRETDIRDSLAVFIIPAGGPQEKIDVNCETGPRGSPWPAGVYSSSSQQQRLRPHQVRLLRNTYNIIKVWIKVYTLICVNILYIYWTLVRNFKDQKILVKSLLSVYVIKVCR